MAAVSIHFDPARAVELILYVSKRLRHPTLHSVSKILYFADRDHLSKYGSLLSGDSYVAMKYGPVPSEIYNLLKAAAGRQESFIPLQYFELVSETLRLEDQYKVQPLREANLDLLSASHRACLDASLKTYGHLSFAKLTAKSHDAAWRSADENGLVLLLGATPRLLLQTVLVPGRRTAEGQIIEAVTIPWFEIIELLKKDPAVAYQISPRKWEEIIAGAYHEAGFDEVTLTPRSGDLGRDVIAVKRGLGSIRVIDQVKAYKPGHLVTADDVRALMGTLQCDGASKGFLTTTSDFAPRLREDPLIVPFVPGRLELIHGKALLLRLAELAKR
jgi:restriction system protein